ncbi:lecithin retinol acyltransferase family protein [Pseudomonas sp. R37(2017)]|uniref:lecithin retinol acyltransferase family protein n=1 Tax=Pseudomonas sp. R37(2017) TaxID=1981685 RepID=UPI000A1F14C6|nr:lecithin retinol acyltransferase family protein [Pseudomonas sp. R37(2017)]
MSLFKTLISPTITPTVVRRPDQEKIDAERRRTERSAINTILEEVFDSQCILLPGSIVACDLGLGLLDHTGIYIGQNQIVERNGDGNIRKVSITTFINASTLRTGVTLYAACANGRLIASPEIAKRAREVVGTDAGYHLIDNNCHKLTAYLATGRRHDITTFSKLASILDTHHPGLEWKSAKVG